MDVSAWTVRPLHESFTIYAHPQNKRSSRQWWWTVMFTICDYVQHVPKMEIKCYFRRFTVCKIHSHKNNLIYVLVQGKCRKVIASGQKWAAIYYKRTKSPNPLEMICFTVIAKWVVVISNVRGSGGTKNTSRHFYVDTHMQQHTYAQVCNNISYSYSRRLYGRLPLTDWEV